MGEAGTRATQAIPGSPPTHGSPPIPALGLRIVHIAGGFSQAFEGSSVM